MPRLYQEILDIGLDRLEAKVEGFKVENLQHDEEFVSAVIEASRLAISTHKQEKREALRNALLNIALHRSTDEDQQQTARPRTEWLGWTASASRGRFGQPCPGHGSPHFRVIVRPAVTRSQSKSPLHLRDPGALLRPDYSPPGHQMLRRR
jgi:hypothetical protein